MGWVVNATPRPFYPRERPGTHCIGGWVGPRADLDVCGKSRPHRDSIPGPSSPQRVPYIYIYIYIYINIYSGSTSQPAPRRPDFSGFQITHNYARTHTDTHTQSRQDSSGLVIRPSPGPLPTQHTTNARDEHDVVSGVRNRIPSIPSGCRPMPQTARPRGSASFGIQNLA